MVSNGNVSESGGGTVQNTKQCSLCNNWNMTMNIVKKEIRTIESRDRNNNLRYPGRFVFTWVRF